MDCTARPASFCSNTNTLATPEPHYIPGYSGYLPQSKYRPGHTYGMTSHRVLLDPCIHMSPQSMLNNVHPENCSDEFGRPGIGGDNLTSSQLALINSRVNSFGRQQYQPNMIPGYTGFVPRFQSILGNSYSPACNRALARFEQDQWRDRLFTKELEALDGWRFCYKTKPWESPETIRPGDGDLQEFARTPCGGSLAQQNIPMSMTSSSSSGRGGGCGCSGGGGGGGGSNYTISRGGFGSSVFPKPIDRIQEIYRHCEGMLPYYQGHVPGSQFRIGKTFGSSTRNSRISNRFI